MEEAHNWGLQDESKKRLFPYIEPDEATKTTISRWLEIYNIFQMWPTLFTIYRHIHLSSRAEPKQDTDGNIQD